MACLCQDPALHHVPQSPTVTASAEETPLVPAAAYEHTHTLVRCKGRLTGGYKNSVFLSLPAEIVGIWEMCGESDFSIHVLYCNNVFGTFVLYFTCPTKAGKHATRESWK